MRRLGLALSVAALVVTSGGVGSAAQTSKDKAPIAAAAPKSLSATGKIVGFDEPSHTLTLSTSKGEEKFVLGSDVRLLEGAKSITTDNLSSLAGRQAKVRYAASASGMTAESVMVSGGARAKSK